MCVSKALTSDNFWIHDVPILVLTHGVLSFDCDFFAPVDMFPVIEAVFRLNWQANIMGTELTELVVYASDDFKM